MHALSFSRKQRFNIGFLAGLPAGIIASALMLLLSITVHGVSLPEALGALFTQVMPLSAFDLLHQALGVDAKYYLLDGILVGQCLVFAVSGGLCNLLASSPRLKQLNNESGQLRWPTGVLLACALWLFTGLVFLPLTGAGIFGASLNIGVVNTMLSLALTGFAFALLFILFQNWLVVRRIRSQATTEDPEAQQMNEKRRALMRNGIVALGVGVVGVLAWRFIASAASMSGAAQASANHLMQNFKNKIVPPPRPNYGTVKEVAQFSSEITPNTKYYVVSKNLVADPVVDAATWQLTVDGDVEKPYKLTYNELLSMPMQEQYESMMCISNEVGGPYMSSAQWQGVQLAKLLERAGGAKSGAHKVVLYAADNYSDSILLSKAMEPTTLLAVRMNGVRLPDGHGFPARLLVPGIYGMKHAKWITHIQVVAQDYQGYWQQRGWSDPAPIRLTSRIDAPSMFGAPLPAHQTIYISGVAFSGNKGISEVDVSKDGGKTWEKATLERPKSNLTWVRWQLPWTPQAAGAYTLMARAVDLEGNVQNPIIAPPLPDGSSGYHTINIVVK